jgi:ABC-type dipeptide/oligopeptide/nickel transport system ATPase component
MIMYAGKLAEKASTDDYQFPGIHIPLLFVRGNRREVFEKILQASPELPLLLDPPTGCRFRERCSSL